MRMWAKKTARAFGYMTSEEIDALVRVVEQIERPRPIIVNIGAGSGISGLVFAEACPQATRYTVDKSEGGPLGGLKNERDAFDLASLPHPNQICARSHITGKTWRYGKIDLLFVDDGHDEDDVRGDVLHWHKRVINGGIMVFHDYGSNNWPAVKEVVDELMANCDVLWHTGTLKAFRVIYGRSWSV